MLDFFELGESLLQAIDSLADFFLETPFSLRADLFELFEPVAEFFGMDNYWAIYHIGNAIGGSEDSIVFYTFGGGLVFILAFKLIKFFVDLVL